MDDEPSTSANEQSDEVELVGGIVDTAYVRAWALVWLGVRVLAVVVILCPAVWAQDSPPETAGTEQSEQVLFEIPAQGLRSALGTFSGQSGWRLVYTGRFQVPSATGE